MRAGGVGAGGRERAGDVSRRGGGVGPGREGAGRELQPVRAGPRGRVPLGACGGGGAAAGPGLRARRDGGGGPRELGGRAARVAAVRGVPAAHAPAGRAALRLQHGRPVAGDDGNIK